MTETVELPDGMNQHEYEVLRILAGEDVPGWVPGAAMNVCITWLCRHGYLTNSHCLTDKGYALLNLREGPYV